MSERKLYYFGCGRGPGHYMFPRFSQSELPDVSRNLMEHIDGTFTPGWSTKQGAAQFSQVGSKVSIIAWHDYTEDKRPGSNSNIIGYGYTGSRNQIIEDMFADFKKQFPSVYQRQTTALVFEDHISVS